MKSFADRQQTRVVHAGPLAIGGGSMISVQSMTTTDTRDAEATCRQIRLLTDAGCDMVRVAVPDKEAADALRAIVNGSPVPLVADIHFDHRLALAALDAGVAKLRINPGTIGAVDKVREVARAAAERHVPIRIGVNAGSLEKELLAKVESGTATLGDAMATSALNEARLLEDCGFADIVLSVKASSVPHTIEACRLLAERSTYPQHVGITEAGTRATGVVKSAAGIGAILSMGIGDTIRVSLTGPSEDEVRAGRRILQALELRPYGPVVISCPTCGRTGVDVTAIAEELERRIAGEPDLRSHICTVAVMGCVVNGPGEARAADIGFAGGKDSGVLFKNGEIVGKVDAADAVETLLRMMKECGN